MTTRPTALPPRVSAPGPLPRAVLLLVAPLNARLLQQLAVLLLRHALAALLDDGTHGTSSSRSVCRCCGTWCRWRTGATPGGRAYLQGVTSRPGARWWWQTPRC